MISSDSNLGGKASARDERGVSPAMLPQTCPLCGCTKSGFLCERHDPHLGARHYFKCPVCALVFLLPGQRSGPAEEKRRYDFHQNNPSDERYLDFLNRLAEPLSARLCPGASGLDFGCGPGPAMSRWFSERGFPTEDYDPIYRPQISLLERTYDFVTCSEVVEHFYNPRREFLLLDRLLAPGAFLGIMTCVLENESGFEAWWYPGDPTHVCFYQQPTLEWIAAWRRWDLERPSANIAIFRKPEEA